MVWEIVRGSYGLDYTATIENENFTGFTATIDIWSRSGTKIVDGYSCSVGYSGTTLDTTVTYTPISTHFPNTLTTGTYNVMIVLTRGSPAAIGKTLKFTIVVYEPEPA